MIPRYRYGRYMWQISSSPGCITRCRGRPRTFFPNFRHRWLTSLLQPLRFAYWFGSLFLFFLPSVHGLVELTAVATSLSYARVAHYTKVRAFRYLRVLTLCGFLHDTNYYCSLHCLLTFSRVLFETPRLWTDRRTMRIPRFLGIRQFVL